MTQLRPPGPCVAALALIATTTLAAVAGEYPPSFQLFDPIVAPHGKYDINCRVTVDSSEVRFEGSQTITLTNDNSLPLERLAFEWTADTLHRLDIIANGIPLIVEPTPGDTLSASTVMVQLPSRVTTGQELKLEIQFEKRVSFQPESSDLLETNWFPRLDWGINAQDDFTVQLNSPRDYTLVTSGRLDSASGVYRADGARRFGIYLARDVEVMRQSAGAVEILVAHTRAGADCANLLMETATDAVQFYSDRFGFYPSDHLVIIPGADSPVGGYPAATNLVVVHGMERFADRDELHWRWITAHEIGHQYWSEHVLQNQKRPFEWLMIGLGIWVDREYVRFRDLPPDKHHEMIDRFIAAVHQGIDTRADVHPDYVTGFDYDFNSTVVHGKGYSVISALNCYLGDSLFDRIHSHCLEEFAGRRMSEHDFQAVCERESSQDLDWFFDQWVRTSRFLSYRIVSQDCRPTANGYRTEVTVERQGTIDMPVPVTARFADGSEQTSFTRRLLETSTLYFDSDTELTEAVIDVDGELANVDPAPTQEELEIRSRLANLPDPDIMADVPRLVEEALSMDIRQTLFWGRLGRKLYDWKLYEEALAVFERRVDLLDQLGSGWVASACGWRGLLLDLLDRRNEAVAAYEEALKSIGDNDFSYDGDPVTINREWLEARLKTPYERR